MISIVLLTHCTVFVLSIEVVFWLLIFSRAGAFYPSVNKWRKLPYKSSPLLIGIQLKIDRFQKRFRDRGMAFQTSCQNKCFRIHCFSSLKIIHISKVVISHQKRSKEFQMLPNFTLSWRVTLSCWGCSFRLSEMSSCLLVGQVTSPHHYDQMSQRSQV